ncbi:fibronectin-binding autotransporter adhesin ShdA [Salmonella enterica subsp. enterica serovar Hull]|uniref:Fibronectin-binding autotransporter adhesin ShdA n=1 Tax=Salmonella enterica subsp. enterica serovar Hull TaxID=1403564 RepID=A0A5I6HXY7_SALET|nr:fibronectin-binding autotransporter adhesin ShdA [Salmonella enterica]EBR8488230.1 fibronectin-binding autotransporter adhesin ShdA [Salmonella enterica subsp. enterica serovar Hull]ECJ4973423.1 fibronectin-binding autotransporter adhesin ShdA [Salmonella enterica subsp. enterica]EBZ7585362.1 fibronectin-binding autotransporter adhesin ShdA [Salmonella enterica subsp. enterica serovar Hull]EBZ8086099.1 fibronectin-binding autotransporter adhesin ShdA [Salmonella enterica subsp. enterica sero
MNRTYSIVWSAVRNMYVVASELARGHSKVKAQVCASETHSPKQKSEYGQIIKATRAALACAVAAALGFFSPLAMADNQVSYIDGTEHDLSTETSPISYSGTGQGTALSLEGLSTDKGGWQATSGTGAGVVIETDGGGDILSGNTRAIGTAVSLNKGATLNLTDAQITTTGIYTTGIDLKEQSSMTLTGGSIQIGGNYGVLTLNGESKATLIGIEVKATTENTSDITSQEGSTLNIEGGSIIMLTNGQVRVVGDTTYNSFLNVTDSTVSSTGTDSTVIASNKGVLDITNSTVTHDNAKGAAIEAANASTVNISGDNKSSMFIKSEGIGIKSARSSVNIDGATVEAKGDGILMTTGGSTFYSNISGLTVENADVTSSDAAALHVDKNTVIETPITLTDSTLTGPTAIKLDNAATVEAKNTTLNGNIEAGSTVSALSLAEKSSLQGSVNGLNSSLTLDETSQWNMTDPSIIGNLTNNGDITLGNASGSTGTLLTVGNTLTLQDGSQINATLDTANSSPIIKAANVTLDGTLNLSSTATFVAPETDEHFGSITLIDSQTAITTDFDSVTLDADTSAMPDYLTINAGVDANDNTNYELSTGLSWYAGANSARAAHGTFTVDADSTFTVTSELDETTATSDWDGSKLTKQGDGTLILSNTGNDYGDTVIDGGILAAKDAASLGTGDVTIAENATLALSQGTLDNNVTGEGQIVKSGSDELIVTGDNNYSGGTTISGGTLTADHADSLGSGDIDNSGVLQVGEGELENTLSGSGSLVKTGTGELTLSGDNTYSGGTTITGGTLTADHADSLGTGTIANSGVLQVGEGELENTLSGSGSLVKTGTGELTLNGDNDYSGGTTINDGVLIAASVNALGSGDIDNSGVLKVGEGELKNTLFGSGSLVKTGTGELTLSGDNTYSGGTTITGGTLTADHADSLGTGAIDNSGVLQVGEGELENTLSGAGSLVKTGTGELTLSGDNSYSGGTTISGGTLTADHADSLGSGDIDNSGVLQVGEGELKNTLSGSGSLVKTGTGELTLSGDNSYSGATTISDGTLIAANVNALGSGNIDNSGTLMLDANGAFELANITTHSGATTALAAGSTLDAGQLIQENGSTLSIDLGAATDDAVITADSVTLGGTLNVTGIGSVTDSWTPEAYTYTLIDSDSAITSDFDNLTVAGMNREDVDFLTIDGKVDETDNTHYDLTASLSWYADRDNATTDAHGTFTLSDPDGSFNVAATLTDVNDTLDPGSRWDGKSLTKEGAGTLILSGDNDYSGGTTINEGTLVAASTTALGTGLVDNNATLVLDADGEVSAVGGITTHSDATTQLALGTSLDLGDSALIQQDGSTLNVELNSDSVQPLITGGSATLGGDLVVSDASLQARASDAEFQSFKLMDMDSDISGDFTSLTMNLTDQPDYLTVTGTINPADASEYLLTEGLSWNATATSATPAHGTFTLGAGDSFEVTSVLGDKTGNGDWDGKSLTKLGAGKLTLSGANTYTGDTNVQEGTLWLSGDGSIGEMGSQQAVNVASGATFGGSNGTTVNGKVTNEGTLVFGDSEETGAIFTLNGDLINMGTMTSGSSSSTPGNTLYVDGNYTGNGGSLYLNTVLGDDDSATDKLVITGDASGTTDLYINGIGDGAQTTNGIEVVDVGGVSTSDAFVLKNEVNASLYTYRLYWNESDNDWYLASKAQSDDDDSGGDDTPSDGGDDGGNVTPPDDGGDGGNVTPPDDGGDGGDVTPPDDGGDVAPQYRADIGAYMGNQWMARNLQMQTLYDREGSQYRNADGSVWARFKAGKAESEAVSGNIDMDSNYSQFQLGGDILAWGNGQQSVTVGVMASYINADTDSTGNRGADGSQFTSSGNVDGYNLGVYATWFADAQTHSGAYVDSWYQYGFYNNSVESGDAGSESYDSTANAVSLETGYRYDIALSNGNTVSLTPQAQVVWQNYSADSVKDNYGTRIDGQDGDSWTTRLGLRVDGKLYKGSRTVIQPFAEANWLHTSDDVSVSFDDATVKQDLPANRAELKVGLQADIDKQWSVRAQVAGQTGSNDFGDLNGSLNLRYNW